MTSNGDDRPSIRDANLALASLLTALKQSGNSPASAAHNAAQSSPAAQQHPYPVVQSSPAYTPAASSVANAGAPTPSAQAAADLSELGTYELLLQLGAHLGVMGAPHTASGAETGQVSAPQAGPSRPLGVGMVGGKAPKDRSMHQASTSALAGPSSDQHGMVYRPQPTRSGRVPQAPSKNSTADPSTVLFNDFFDFPSDDEEEDPDFDPNDPMVDFWGDLLSKERADGDVTETEGDWAGANTQGITGDEFAREIALLTSTLDDPLPPIDGFDVNGRGRTTSSATPPTLRSSPRRRSTGIPVTQSAPQQTSPRRRRRGLSPVPEDPAFHDWTPGFQFDPPASLHHHLPLHSLLDYRQQVDPNPQLSLPPPSASSTVTSSIADDAEEPAPTKKKRNRKRKYTPEEAAARRKEQEKERQAKRRKTEKQRKEEREKQFAHLEIENKELQVKCAALEEREAVDEGEEEEESDGGEYQVQSSDESSSEEDSESEGQDAAAYIGAVAAELAQLQQVTSPPQPSPAASQPVPPAPLNLSLATIGQDALSQLLSIVHSAAKQQGIALANSPAS
ncbi:transmembrane ATP-binding protein ABC transporter [Rhodotorula toruloides]|uniref:Transmembrane ATP-binding protein ABC transporter n=1 Tax=Rhodotorula toruloides TaxID=5286 RepID=A0A511KIJ0_RHOTO|nr:transmembrane ATP-binding protein ABC transporter [Rhodotorula toruloides]